MMGVANAEILPFDWRATMQEFRTTIDRYQKAAGDALDLTPSKAAVAALDEALAAFYASTIEPARKNAVIQRLARILVPINFTTRPRLRHDPALPVPPLPTIASAADLEHHGAETIGFARTQLMRGQNRLVAALREARRLVESA